MPRSPIRECHLEAGINDGRGDMTDSNEWSLLHDLQSEFESRLPEFFTVAYEDLAPFGVVQETEEVVVFRVPDSFWDELEAEYDISDDSRIVIQQAYQEYVRDTFGDSYYPGDVIVVEKPKTFQQGGESVAIELRKLIEEGISPRNAVDFVTVRRDVIDIAEVVHQRNISFGELAEIFNRCQSVLNETDD